MSDDTTASDNDSAASAEPSMEDILASIRRIIADDDSDATSSDLMLEDDLETAAPTAPALSLVKTETIDAQGDDMMAEPLSSLDFADLDRIEMEDDLALTLEDVITDEGAELQGTETHSLAVDRVDIDTLDLSFDDSDLDLDTLPIPDSDMDAGTSALLDTADAETATSDDDTTALDALLLDDLLVPDTTDGATADERLEAERVEDELADSDMDFDAIFDTPADDVVPEDSPVDERVIDPAADLLADDDLDDTSADDLDDTDDLIDALFNNHDSEEVVQSTVPAASTRDTDLDLVKSLMADLTDDSFLVSDTAPAPVAVVAQPEAAQTAVPSDVNDDMDNEGDVMDDILALTLEDEAALRDTENTIDAATATDEMAMDAMMLDDMASVMPPIDSVDLSDDAAEDTTAVTAATASKSLSQIAEDARAEAARVENEDTLRANDTTEAGANPAVSAAAMLAGLAGGAAVVGAAVSSADTHKNDRPKNDGSNQGVSEPDASQAVSTEAILQQPIEPSLEDMENLIMEGAAMDADAPAVAQPEPETAALSTEALDTDDTNINIETESFEETHPMPKTAKQPSDAILDEVTETATASVFASLNSVVEEKAIVAERGDRIGDLVQEALRPMLKDWLDANLKGIVERAVAKEVKRISSGK